MKDPTAPQLDSIANIEAIRKITKVSRQSRGYKTRSSKDLKKGDRKNSSEIVAQAKSMNPFAEHTASIHTMLTQSSQVKEQLSVKKETPGMSFCIHRRNKQ